MKNKITISTLLFICSTELLPTVAYCAEDKQNMSSSEQMIEKDKHINNLSMKKKSNDQNAIKNNRTWPDVFVPSEKINADSVIAFPVDI